MISHARESCLLEIQAGKLWQRYPSKVNQQLKYSRVLGDSSDDPLMTSGGVLDRQVALILTSQQNYPHASQDGLFPTKFRVRKLGLAGCHDLSYNLHWNVIL